jgi:dolichyl-phosphate beta-glucosyltransferase
MYLSLVIPAYNEADRIGDTLVAADRYFVRQDYDAEIIVVDDGSHDDTAEVVRGHQQERRTPVRLKSLTENRGKGCAVKAGMLEQATGRFRFFCDADGSTPIEELDRCGALFESQADIVIGSRALPDSIIQQRQAWYRENMGRCYNRIERILGITPYSDTQCGFKGFTDKAAEICFIRQTVSRFSFDAELLYIAAKHGLNILEIPVRWINSPNSKVNPVRDASRMFLDLVAIRLKDLSGRYD